MTRWVAFALLTVTACTPAMDQLKPALGASEAGTIWFATGERDVLSGDLTFPPGSGPFPAVVLMHGCGGLPSRTIAGWEPLLRSWGYATFVVDSFRGRSLLEVCTDALALTGNRRIPDAYAALRILATHPKIDRNQVVLMGFSHGGIVALVAATQWARDTYAGDAGVAFRAFLPFYPYCNAVIPEMTRGFAAPVRIHIGKLDDWTPARPCQALTGVARNSGADVRITVYKNAHHAFDAVGRPVERVSNVDNAADCTPRLASPNGPILNLDASTSSKGACARGRRSAGAPRRPRRRGGTSRPSSPSS